MPANGGGFQDIGPAKEIIDTRQGTAWSANGSRRYLRKFIVKTTNRARGANEICQAAGVPLPFEPYTSPDGHTTDVAALCIRLDAELKSADDRFWWVVTAEFSTEVPNYGPSSAQTGGSFLGTQNNPWQEPPHIRWDGEVVQRALAKDLDDRPFLNAAGQHFDPPPTFETGRLVLIVTRNEITFDPSIAIRYAFAVNSDVFMGVPPGSAQLLPIQGEQDFRGSLEYFRVTYRVRFAGALKVDPEGGILEHDTWQPRILNAGMAGRQRISSLLPFYGQAVPIIRRGVPVSRPVLLDDNGGELRPTIGGVGGYVWPDPTYIDFRVYLSLPFANILTNGLMNSPP